MATSTLLINQTQFVDKTKNRQVWSSPEFQAVLVALHETALQDEFDGCITGLQSRTETDTLTAADTALLDYMQPYIAYKALAEYVYASAVSVSGAGTGRDLSESWEPASATSRNQAAKQHELTAKRYFDKLMQFIADNAADYPCFVESTSRNQLPGFFDSVFSSGTDYVGASDDDDIYPYTKRTRL